ncbi:DUF115 domain-containing protein [bacterium]|nr:DUF115 domain-containing protein [bacterium]
MSFLEQNIAVLKQTRPHLAELVENHHFDPNRYVLIDTQSGYPTMEIRLNDVQTILMHSKYDPMKEAEREIQRLDRSKIILPLFAGIGLGYSVAYLWKNNRECFASLAIVERDPAIFLRAMEMTDFQELFADPRVFIHVGDDLQPWGGVVNEMIPAIMSSQLQMIPHPSSQSHFSDFYKVALDILNAKMHQSYAEFDFMSRCGPQIHENLWRNLPSIVRAYGVSDVKDCLKGKPAIIVAAGPSLDKNVHHLKDAQSQYPIIAVDTAVRTLQKNGIEPDIVVTADPNEINCQHFIDTHARPETILAYNPEIYHSIPNQWPYRHIFLNLDKEEFTRWIERVIGPYGINQKGGSVSHAAFYLVRAMQADPIIFIGLDLAYNPQGGSTHAGQAALKRDYAAITKGTNTTQLGQMRNLPGKQEQIAWVRGIEQEWVPTSKIMSIFIQQFSEEFSSRQGTVIDATEGGARIAGTEIMPLREALAKNPGAKVHYLPAKQSRQRNLPALLAEIERIEKTLQKGAEKGKRGLELTHQLALRTKEGAKLKETVEWRELNDCFNAIYYEEDIKIALGQALFKAIHQFIQKEFDYQVEIRLKKYHNFFTIFMNVYPHFANVIKQTKDRLAK